LTIVDVLDEITARNVICLPEEAVERAAWEALKKDRGND
jgi:hypothetical protein